MVILLRVDTVNRWIPNVKSMSKIMIAFNRISTMPRSFPPLDRLLTRWTILKVFRGLRIRLSCIKISKKILISTTIASNLHHTLRPCTGTALKYPMLHTTKIMSNSSKILPQLIHVQPYLKGIIPKCQLNRCLPTCYQKPRNISLKTTKSHSKWHIIQNQGSNKNHSKNPNRRARNRILTNSGLI